MVIRDSLILNNALLHLVWLSDCHNISTRLLYHAFIVIIMHETVILIAYILLCSKLCIADNISGGGDNSVDHPRYNVASHTNIHFVQV